MRFTRALVMAFLLMLTVISGFPLAVARRPVSMQPARIGETMTATSANIFMASS
jgi:hypothetical protein